MRIEQDMSGDYCRTLIGRLESLDRADLLLNLLSEFATETGAAHVAYSALSRRSKDGLPLFYLTYHDDWINRYITNEYVHIDPVVAAVGECTAPFDWAGFHGVSCWRPFFRESVSYGVGRHGLTIPIRGVGNTEGMLSVTALCSDREWTAARWPMQSIVSLLAPYIHETALRLSRRDVSLEWEALSERQTECLEHFARGLSPKEIGTRLGISGTMVRTHLHASRRKLGCLSLSSTAVKAAKLGMVRV